MSARVAPAQATAEPEAPAAFGRFEAEEPLPISDLPIEPDVGLEVRASTWQDDPEVTIVEALPFVIEGPKHVIKFLEAETGCSSVGGFLSPPNKITIRGERARIAGIPADAAFYAFAYPLESLSGQYRRLIDAEGRAEPWLFFLLLGGYCYFDASRRLIRTNAFVMHPTERKLTLAGPFQPSAEAVAALKAASRLRELTLEPLREQGFERFAWVNPGERPGGRSLLADGGDLPSNGAFLFEAAGGEAVLYSLINKALFGVEEGPSAPSTLLSMPSRLGEHRSGRAENANALLDK